MYTSCAIMALSVTPLTEEEGVEVDGTVEARGAVVCVWVASSEAVQDSA